jgi:peptide/nickel transport system ATP-binding protein
MHSTVTPSEQETARRSAEPLVSIEGLSVDYALDGGGLWKRRERMLRAVDDITFEIPRGETLGLVGESGSGKTTTGRAVLRKVPLATGRIVFDGEDITEMRGETLRRFRRRMQLVFQDPYASLNPRMRVFEIVAEPLLVHGVVRRIRDAEEQVRDLLALVGLPPEVMFRYPHAFSGGQRVWNRQPAGGSARFGTLPRNTMRRRAFSSAGSGIGTAERSARVYGCFASS